MEEEFYEADEYEPEPWSPPEFRPTHHRFLTDDGVSIHYVEWPADPDAPVLLMVHGRRAHARWFDPVAAGLSPRYRCVAMDLRGHGESTANGEPATLDRYSADLAQMMDRFKDEKLILLAHSMAGRFAILATQNYGRKPGLLVMADTPIYRRPHHMQAEPEFKPKRYPEKEHALQRFRLMPIGTSAHPDLIQYVAEHALRQLDDGSWTWKFNERSTTRPFGSDFPDATDLNLEALDCPTLIIYGEHSVLFDREEAEITASRFPKSKIVELPGTHHHIMLDRPSAFNQALIEFFAENGF